ncbi:hypothetical protein [Fictibacillus enclensis]|uniref:hypothetical protein n=1 Tax=Fictibacillus enclensis TaxID=1017270 RepID=UPI003B9692CC
MQDPIGTGFLIIVHKSPRQKQLGELTYFNYATSIAFGNIVGEMIIHYKDVSISNGIVAVVIWVLLILGIEFRGWETDEREFEGIRTK